MTRGYAWLAVGSKSDIVTGNKPLAPYDLALIGIPYYQLTARRIHKVKLVYVAHLARTASVIAESYLAQTPYLFHHIG